MYQQKKIKLEFRLISKYIFERREALSFIVCFLLIFGGKGIDAQENNADKINICMGTIAQFYKSLGGKIFILGRIIAFLANSNLPFGASTSPGIKTQPQNHRPTNCPKGRIRNSIQTISDPNLEPLSRFWSHYQGSEDLWANIRSQNMKVLVVIMIGVKFVRIWPSSREEIPL